MLSLHLYLLIPRRLYLLWKTTVSQILMKFPATYKFITVLKKARHLTFTWDRLIQPTPPHPMLLRLILILYSCQCLDLPWGRLPLSFPFKRSKHFYHQFPDVPPISPSLNWSSLHYFVWTTNYEAPHCAMFLPSCVLLPLMSKYLHEHAFPSILIVCSSLNATHLVSNPHKRGKIITV
jgi:hypothetical protein